LLGVSVALVVAQVFQLFANGGVILYVLYKKSRLQEIQEKV
jgi:hypothetical protein